MVSKIKDNNISCVELQISFLFVKSYLYLHQTIKVSESMDHCAVLMKYMLQGVAVYMYMYIGIKIMVPKQTKFFLSLLF